MESNFRSTVLARPQGVRNEDDDDRRRRDIPGAQTGAGLTHGPQSGTGSSGIRTGSGTGIGSGTGSGTGAPPAPPAPPPRASFSLRSPTQSQSAALPHPPPFGSPSASTNGNNSQPASRSILNAPYISSPSSAAARPASSSASSNRPPLGSAAGQPQSPLQAPPSYFPSELRDPHHPPREKTTTATATATRSFYDPLTDTTTTVKDRRGSETGSASAASWQGANHQASPPKHRDPYHYSSHHQADSPYYNSSYKSPTTASAYPPRSPVSRSRHHHHTSVGSISPPTKTSQMGSPSMRQSAAPSGASASNGNSTPANGVGRYSRTESPAPPPKATAPATTPSRAAELMSFSNILSSSEPTEQPKAKSPARTEEPEKEEVKPKIEKVEERKPKAVRKVKSRASDVRHAESTPKTSSRRASSKISSESRVPAKRTANGQSKKKGLSVEKEKIIRDLMEKFDDESEEIEESLFDAELKSFKERALRRRTEMTEREFNVHTARRDEFIDLTTKKLGVHTDLGKRRYDDVFYEDAMQEVRERELFAEKERKKDMQRKRRREKSMAVTMEQKDAALKRAAAAEDEQERQKHLREAERANKKAQQTKLILQKGLKGPARNLAPIELNHEGGVMATFTATDMEPGKGKTKGRGGSRLKKSKEQKQQEKDNAEAAQAAIDAGEELPPPREEPKIRIKISKKGNKDKDKEREDNQNDKENQEPKEPKIKEKAEEPKVTLETRFQSKGYNQIYDQICRDYSRKDINKVYRLATEAYSVKCSNLKKTAILASKEAKRWQLRTNKGTKDLQARAKRVMRDMMSFWKRNEREERDLRKAAEKQELENARKEEADREAARQKRKLNFLITQTELYSHFIGKKMKTQEVERSTDHPDVAPDEHDKTHDANDITVKDSSGVVGGKVTNFENLTFEEEDEDTLHAAAMANAQNAIAEAQAKAREFNQEEDDMQMDEEGEMNFQNPTGLGDIEIEQPKLLNAQLKEYQLKGLNWLVNLYEQGINGILADEMGLGKTIQSISVMAYLAEHHDIWGPFLVVAPASTLHNWQQEIKRFVPELKVLPYWGSAGDRKVLRKFWDRKHSKYKKDAQFHVLITSYQLVVADVAYMSKMKWQYMILDEAQAIKSSQSSRWKVLLNYHCRNRLLLTGTPIQNNMQELWALLHFIMPSLFDSHDEFSEWFSKDIESHAQSNTKLNEDQLKRLHMILKPFMLRRVKKHVQKELGDKIELDVFCDLTYRQRAMYANLRNQISIMDLIEKATLGDDNDSGTLMNLVMQFRKVCNHPDLFERADTSSPFSMSIFAETASFAREGNNVPVGYSSRSCIEYPLPRLIWREGGRLRVAGSDNVRAGFRNKYLDHMMNIWTPDNMRESTSGTDTFSWLRFADTSVGEVSKAAHEDLFMRATRLAQEPNRLGVMNVAYDEPEDIKYTPAHAMFSIVKRADRNPLANITSEGVLNRLMNVARESYDNTGLTRLDQAGHPKATAPPAEVACDSRGTIIERENVMFNVPVRRALYGPNPLEEKALITQKVSPAHYPTRALLPAPDVEKKRFNNISVPSMRRFVTDSGKLAKLDQLLFKLKEEGHRVLLYFQMTRMIDLMEEYLTFRNYKYCRLDGSTKLEDRRDTVSDFQSRPEIFIFLLSTRAGGLGINLTSADTVIFYDSDWNPTIDSQAMDRAHRLGQTRQVTVYRLITRGTIEERIRKRALQKEEVQRVVISGGAGASSAGGVDFSGRRAPENRNRDIAMWLADDEQAEMIERREKELLEAGEYDKQTKKKGGSKKKRGGGGGGAGGEVSLDDMYHEGEGNFDDNKASGTATPVDGGGDARDGGAAGAGGKRKRGNAKKAKTTKQRLAIADGQMDI